MNYRELFTTATWYSTLAEKLSSASQKRTRELKIKESVKLSLSMLQQHILPLALALAKLFVSENVIFSPC